DHLWKLFRAFRSNTFGGASFEDFCAALEARYGKGVWREGSVRPGEPPTRWLEWEGKTVRVRAIDNSTFYGFYSLVFEDMSIVKRLDKLRPNRGPQGPRRHPVVESVTDDREAVIVVDEHADIADRITGREDREDPKKKKRGGGVRPGLFKLAAGRFDRFAAGLPNRALHRFIAFPTDEARARI